MEELEFEEDDELVNELQLVSFKLGEEEFGIIIDNVQEIIRMKPLTHIPGASQFVDGVIDLRGNILPVIDLRKKLNLPPKEADELTRIIVINLGNINTGIIVDTVLEVLRISKEEVKSPPSLLGSEVKFIEGIIKRDFRLIILLDVKNILTEEDVINISNITKRMSGDITEIEEESIYESKERIENKVTDDTPRLCKWVNKDGTHCTRLAMKGSDYCEIHQTEV